MERILKHLYHGTMYPYSKFKTTIDQYRSNREQAFQSYSLFLDKLPDNLKEDFNELIDSHLDLLPLELEQTFIDGFRIGVRIMTEVFLSSEDK